MLGVARFGRGWGALTQTGRVGQDRTVPGCGSIRTHPLFHFRVASLL